MMFESEALNASQSRKLRRTLTWKDRVGFCWISGRGMTPAVATQSTLFVFLLVRCLTTLGRYILVIQLPCLPLSPFAFPPSHLQHAVCPICFKSQLVSGVVTGGSLPQSHGYRVDPAASSRGILPWERVRLGTGNGGRPVVEVL